MRRDGGKAFQIVSWSLYDLANQFFALNVVSLYFPRWLTVEKNSPEIFYGLAFGASMFLVAACAPFLGTMADIAKKRKYYLILFTLLSVIFTALLSISGNVLMALVFFAIANFGCQEAIIFYNALLVNVSPGKRIGLVSGLGRMFGYTGAILALLITRPIVLRTGYQATFLVTAVLFLIFALPCMIFVKEERGKSDMVPGVSTGKISTIVMENMKKMRNIAGFGNFLAAAFFMLCAVNTVMIFMAVYAGRVFGLSEAGIIDLIAFSTVFAIIGSIVSGQVSDVIGYRRALLGILSLWVACLLGGSLVKVPFHWAVGALAGFSLGATWVVLRALVIRLVPKENVGQAFGVFNLVGYLSGIVGPVCWGLNLLYLSRFGELGYRVSLSSLILFLLVGSFFLLRVKKNAYGDAKY